MGFMQSMGTGKKIFMWIGCIPLVPFICLVYIISPHSKVAVVVVVVVVVVF